MLCNRSSLATAAAASRNPVSTTDSPPVGTFAFAILCRRVMSVSRWAGRPVPPGGTSPSLPACVPACRYCFSQSRNVQPDRTGPAPASCVDRRTHSLTHSLGRRRSDRRAGHGCAVDKQCAAFDGPCGMKYSASPRQVEPRATSAPGLGSPLPHLHRDLTLAPALEPVAAQACPSYIYACDDAPELRCRMAQSCTSVQDCSPI